MNCDDVADEELDALVTFFMYNRQGEAVEPASDATIEAVLAELDGYTDDEHPDVSLTHESEWCLSAFPDGLLVWEIAEESGVPRHMSGVPRSEVRRLWAALARGDLAEVNAQPWRQGYGP